MSQNHIQASGALFQAVQLARLFPDSKTFPDSLPKKDPELLWQAFRERLRVFVEESFELPEEAGKSGAIANVASMEAHIDNLWPLLRREPDREALEFSTSIPLPYPYVVPGGRFREIYYWDSYFTALGLVSEHTELLESMIKNFAYLIDSYGHIPNGNRSYFVSRSQPPFFCSMLQLLQRERGFAVVEPYLGHLEAEYRFWMAGKAELCNLSLGGQRASKRTVMLADGVILNRYWDENNTPREESFGEDVELFERVSPRRQADIYRNIRAGAESGWDFSSRWLGENGEMTSIRTTEIIPVDLNCLLFNIEQQLADWLTRIKEPRATEYALAAARRKAALLTYCWNEEQGWFFDYCWREQEQTDSWSIAGAYPLFCHLASPSQASRAAEQIKKRFLKAGGVVTTLTETGEQWDYPNGWAPLQWVTVQGLLNYQHDELAHDIAKRFVELAEKVFKENGKMVEKYNVCDLNIHAGGGEYALQDGFGWTNGVVKAFVSLLRSQANE